MDTSAYVLGVSIDDKKSLQNINETGSTTAPYPSIDNHQARLAKNTNPSSNTCEVQISASTNTTLTISVDPLLEGIDYACNVVEQATPILVANLPTNW